MSAIRGDDARAARGDGAKAVRGDDAKADCGDDAKAARGDDARATRGVGLKNSCSFNLRGPGGWVFRRFVLVTRRVKIDFEWSSRCILARVEGRRDLPTRWG